MFDLRGHGFSGAFSTTKQHVTETDPQIRYPFQQNGFNGEMISWGDNEAQDIQMIIEHHLNKRTEKGLPNYEEVIGIALCYGGYIFAQTAARFPTLFNKLILDGVCHQPLAGHYPPPNPQPLTHFLQEIKVPVLFIKGSTEHLYDDKALFKMAQTLRQPFLIFHSCRNHCRSYLEEPNAYTAITNLFIDYSFSDCVTLLKEKKETL